jgi:hypothetical protein
LAHGVQHGRDLGHDLGEIAAPACVDVGRQQVRRRSVGKIDAAVGVEPDHPGRHPGQHRLHEVAPGVELSVGLHQLLALALQLPGHAVEGASQRADLVRDAALGHARGEVAGAHALGGRRERGDRPREIGREGEADPDRGQQQQQHHEDEHGGDDGLEARSLALDGLVLGHGLAGSRNVVQHLRLDIAADPQIGVDQAVELDDRANTVVGLARDDDDLAVAGALDRPVRRRLLLQNEAFSHAQPDAPAAVHDIGLAQVPEQGLLGEDPVEQLRLVPDLARFPVDVARHGQDVAPDDLLMFLQIRFRDQLRFGQCRPHRVGEPRLDAEAEENREEHRDDHRRRQRHQAEQHHQPGMEPGPDRAAPAFHPQQHQPPRDDGAKDEEQNGIDIEVDQDRSRIRPQRRRAGQRGIGRQRRDQRGDGERDGENAPEPKAPGPGGDAGPETRPLGERITSHRTNPSSPESPAWPRRLGHRAYRAIILGPARP